MIYHELQVHLDDGRKLSLKVRSGSTLEAASVKHDLPLEFDCRKADCGICAFRLLDGKQALNEMSTAEKDFLRAMRAADDERLACQCRVIGDAVIAIDNPMPD